MRPIHIAKLDESRPVLILTRELVLTQALLNAFDLDVG